MQAESISNGQGIEEVVYLLRPKISAILARYQIPAADGDDLVQEAILAALEWERRQQLGNIDNIEAWFLAVVRNRCAVHLRRRNCWKRLVQSVDPSELDSLARPIEPPQDQQDACRDLRMLWRQLSAAERKLLWMCVEEDLGRKEVATQLRCHPANIVKLLRRVLARLRAASQLRSVYR